MQTDDLEQLCTAVTGYRRNTHLGHDLEQPLANTTPIVSPELLLLIEIAALSDIVQRLVNQVRINQRCPVADQARKMVWVAGNTRFYDDVHVAA